MNIERGNATTDGGLVGAQAVSRGREAAGLDDGDKGSQVFEGIHC